MSQTFPTRRPLDRRRRHDALVLYAFAWGRRRDLRRAGAGPSELSDVEQLAAEAREAYRDSVPVIGLARCPFTDEVAYHSLDPVDLDGLWWDYDNPVRPVEDLPSTWLAMPGAMRLAPEVTTVPFLAKPGPARPFVVHRLISHPAVRAVISQVAVGAHTGWPVTYFASGPVGDRDYVNTWGAPTYPVRRADGTWGWAQVTEWSPDCDYDLRPWLASGRLLWIAPGDASLTLREGVDRCPYVGITGSTEWARIEGGEVRYPEPPPPGAPAWR